MEEDEGERMVTQEVSCSGPCGSVVEAVLVACNAVGLSEGTKLFWLLRLVCASVWLELGGLSFTAASQ